MFEDGSGAKLQFMGIESVYDSWSSGLQGDKKVARFSITFDSWNEHEFLVNLEDIGKLLAGVEINVG